MTKHKAFTLLELLIASALFAVTMIGIITLISTVASSVKQSLSDRDINSTLRNMNDKITAIIGNAKCVKAEGEDAVVLYSDDCANKVGKLIYVKNSIVVSDLNKETTLNPSDIKISKAKDQPIWNTVEDRLLQIKIVVSRPNDNTGRMVQYQTSYITEL